MFAKENEKIESLIGVHSHFTGDINAQGTLRVEGRVDGQVMADFVVLTETAVVRGDISAKKIIIGGKVEGNLKAQETVEIKSKGDLLGEIEAKRFSVMEGGAINGKVEMQEEVAVLQDLMSKGQ